MADTWQWVSSGGGPLAVIPLTVLDHWSGTEPPAAPLPLPARAKRRAPPAPPPF